MTITLADEAATERLGAMIGAALRAGDTVTLSGALGSGKTTLVRAIIAALGHRGEVPSPSFAILHYYDPPEVRLPVVHADFYRLEDGAELAELGLDDDPAGVVLAEWPERVGGLAGPATLELKIAGSDASARQLTAAPGPSWTQRWARITEEA